MDINISGIKNQLQVGYQFAVEEGGKLAGHTVKLFNQALEHVRQDARLAGATIVVANILFIEITLRVTNLIDNILIYPLGPEKDWSEGTKMVNSFVVLILVGSLITGMNIALYQELKSPLSPAFATLISSATCISYMAFYFYRANSRNGSEG